ncbi:type I polyketide synthase [Actinomadura chokoriensis]|uniref:SDR family NAD(P)-dependent oxidoreductase n=1 Tax=Actinomadura chokoriensis TaxID=454156 RepID=A0ABV4QWW7_9ACTN
MPGEQRAYEDSLDIAVIGMAGRFPQARDVTEFWRNLRSGKISLEHLGEADLRERGVPRELISDPQYVAAGNLLDGIELFDADFFGYGPREAELIDPQHRILLECAWTALENAGYAPERYDGLIGIYAGAGNNTYLLHNIASYGELIETMGGNQVMLANGTDFLATRVAYKLGFEGPSVSVQSACSTSLVAVALACQSLLAFQCDMVLAGGVSVDVLKQRGYLYNRDGLYSPDGLCRPFDAAAQGTSAGNGVGLVVLKRLADAVADGDRVHAVIKGSAINNDGSRRAGFTAPSPESQALAITTALAAADVEPRTVGFVEAHGTATVLGDPIEVAALNAAFGGRPAGRARCALGSVKGNIGHLDAAAGVAGLIKAILAVEHGEIPPTAHFTEPNPRIDFAAGPFFVNSEPVPWPVDEGPRRAGVSSFGLGGTNAHVVLEQAPPRPPAPEPDTRPQLLVISAKTPDALESATDGLAGYLGGSPETALADVAFTLQNGRTAFRHRRVLVCGDAEDGRRILEDRDDGRLLTGEAPAAGSRPVAFMFTGAGSEYPGMGARLHRDQPVFRAAFDRCAAILRPHLGLDIAEVVFAREDRPSSGETPAAGFDLRRLRSRERSDHPLHRPLLCHPATFAVEYALVELWRSWGVTPDAMIGHSFGEHVAACVAGVLPLEEALSLAVARARLVEEQPAGAMVAVALGPEEIVRFLGEEVALAAVNSPQTCVLSGAEAAVKDVVGELDAEGIGCRPLPTGTASHSPLVGPVAEAYADMLTGVRLRPPRLRFVSTVTGTWITDEQATSPAYWARQMRETVRFADGVATLWSDPRTVLLEIGPGQALCSAALQHPAKRRAADPVAVPSMPDGHDRTGESAAVQRSLGRLWLAGVPVDWAALHPGVRRRVALPTYPFQRRRYWLDAGERGGRVAGTPGRRGAAPDDWLYTPTWQRTDAVPAEPPDGPAGRRWLVFADEHGLAARLVARLRAAGAEVITVTAGGGAGDHTLNPHRADDYRALAETLRSTGGIPGRVLHCWGVGPVADRSAGPETTREVLARGFHSLAGWLRASAPELLSEPVRWDVLTSGVHAVTGEEPVCPAKATGGAIGMIAVQEYPFLSCRQLDVLVPRAEEEAERLTGRLMAELLTPREEADVALRGPHRWVRSFLPLRRPGPDRSLLRPGGVYMITGGLGRIGLVLARCLAESVKARLVLVGRTGLPPAATWDDPDHPEPVRAAVGAVRDLRALGAQVMVAAADVADEDRMRRLVERVAAEFGPLNGVIHAAGVTGARAHRFLADLDPAEGEVHFRPKLHGVHVLDRVLQGHDLDFAILCSSLSPLLGGLGFGAYAAANAFMDAYAQRPGSRWVSVNWEGWRFPNDESDVGATLRKLVISPEEGREVFESLLSRPLPPQVVVSTGDLAQRRRQWSAPGEAPQPVTALHPRPGLGNPYVAPDGETERRIAEIWQSLLGIDRVGANDSFFELGGTSLLGIQVIHRLRRDLGLAAPLTVLYEGPTVRTMARLVDEIGERSG